MRPLATRLLRLSVPLLLLGVLGCRVFVLPGGFGSGTVTIQPGSIVCTISTGVTSPECSSLFDSDDEVILTAVAAAGSVFNGWSGDCDSIAANVCTTTANRLRFVTADFQPASVPSAPSALVVSPVSATQIGLQWQDNANNEAGYFVERCTGADCTSFAQIDQLGANSTAYLDQGLTTGTTYRYRVRAGNVLGFSGYVTSGNVTTP